MKKIKLMADYECFPLWEILDDGVENINPDSLSIPCSLKKSLREWAKVYDSTLNKIDPVNSGFITKIAEIDFENEGMRLYQELQLHLGKKINVIYFSRMETKLYV